MTGATGSHPPQVTAALVDGSDFLVEVVDHVPHPPAGVVVVLEVVVFLVLAAGVEVVDHVPQAGSVVVDFLVLLEVVDQVPHPGVVVVVVVVVLEEVVEEEDHPSQS